MANINRRYIDKHWSIFLVRGALALIFGCLISFGNLSNLSTVIPVIGLLLLTLGVVDTVSALVDSLKERGWGVSVADALIDVLAALALFFYAQDDLVVSLIIIATYTLVSGIIDIFHSIFSTVDPTDRFIRALVGGCGCVMGIVILNTGVFEASMFLRFFGAYLMIVGVTSLVYGVHNRAQMIEEKAARTRKVAAKSTTKAVKKKTAKKKTTKKN